MSPVNVHILRDYRNGTTVKRLFLLLGIAVLNSGHTDNTGNSVHQDHPVHRPQFGSAKGLITMSDNFDEPLEDFNEYM